MSDVRTTSQLSQELSQRIQTNQKFGDADMKSWLLEKLSLQVGEKLLDVGCGTGAYLIPYAKITKADFACTGVDLSEKSIETARQTGEREKLKINLFVESMDDLKESVTKGPFDRITFAYSAYYSKDATKMFTSLLKHLKPSGQLAVLGPYLDNNQEWFDFLRQFMVLPTHAQESSGTFMGNVALPFALSQFSEIQCYRFVNNITIPTIEELQKYWEANTYFDPKQNDSFRKFSELHFKKYSVFKYRKAALLAIMRQKRD